jgi:3-deoxy-manno-octulosonate cytidylyltransferase (CMP-KDO synthetase)
VVIATDDERIAAAVEGFGGIAVMTSPDCLSGTDRVAEAASRICADIVVNVQGDEPLIDPAAIEAVVGKITADMDIACATAAFETRDEQLFRDPNAVKVVIDRAGQALYFSRSPLPFDRDVEFTQAYIHIGMYAFRREFLEKWPTLKPSALEQREKLEQLRMLENGYKIGVVITGQPSIGVDTPADLERVRKMIDSPPPLLRGEKEI